MSQKKATTKGSKKSTAEGRKRATSRRGWLPALKEKAHEIIADADTYDERTRESIRRALEEGDERLPDMVKSAEIRVSPEPADKSSDAWRYWKLRNLEFDLESDDEGRRASAWREFDELYRWFRGSSQQPGSTAQAVLPYLISAWQREGGEAQADQLTQRAQVIIRDRNGRYDYDTRHAVWLALKNYEFNASGGEGVRLSEAVRAEMRAETAKYERQLAEDITRAEAGEYLGFVSAGQEHVEAARRVLGLMYSPGIPDFINQGIYDLLLIAEKTFGLKLFLDEIGEPETGGWSIARLAGTFMRHDAGTFKIETERDFAGLISAVIQHKEMPTELRETMIQFLSHLAEPDEVTIHPDALRIAIGIYWRDKEGGDE
jgi:hypothetical protein